MAKGVVMKWKKYRDLQVKCPFIADDLCWGFIYPNTKDFVRTRISFIAFRPFESLDLSAKQTSTRSLGGDCTSSEIPCCKTVDYKVVFHVQFEENATRLFQVTDDKGDGSIQAHIDDVTTWFDSQEEFVGKQLVWDRVVKRTANRVLQTRQITNMSLEIYLFPKFYRFKPMPSRPYSPPNPEYDAWVKEKPLPPILPGTLKSAW